MKIVSQGALVLTLAFLAAPPTRAGNPGSAPNAASTQQDVATTTLALIGLEAPIPRAWERQPPASAMRLAQFRVPGAGESDPAEFVVYYFGAGQGGSAEANIARWRSQFSSPGGQPVEPVVTTFRVGDLPVTRVELHGGYARGAGMGPVGEPKPDQTLLAAIIEAPRGNLYAQLHGPASTVGDWAAAFDAFVDGLHTAAQESEP